MKGKFRNLMLAASRKGHKLALLGKKHAPDILVYGGIALGVAAGVLACKSTLKADEVLDKHEDSMEKINRAYNEDEEYSERDKQLDTVKVYGQTAIGFVKLYLPSLLMGTAAAASIATGHNMMKRRYAGAIAAYSAVATAYSAYRERVIKAEGIDKDLEYRGIKREEVAYTTYDEDGNECVSHEVVYTVDDTNQNAEIGASPYARFFDSCNVNFNKDPEMNRWFLTRVQKYCNEKLAAYGYLFLNDVYYELGFEPTKAGQIVGWIYDPNNKVGDNLVDFGITKVRNNRFVNGYEYVCLLDFNVDGPILDRVKIAEK